jgi:hypothetical protein
MATHHGGEVIVEATHGEPEYDAHDDRYKDPPYRFYKEYDRGTHPRAIEDDLIDFYRKPGAYRQQYAAGESSQAADRNYMDIARSILAESEAAGGENLHAIMKRRGIVDIKAKRPILLAVDALRTWPRGKVGPPTQARAQAMQQQQAQGLPDHTKPPSVEQYKADPGQGMLFDADRGRPGVAGQLPEQTTHPDSAWPDFSTDDEKAVQEVIQGRRKAHEATDRRTGHRYRYSAEGTGLSVERTRSGWSSSEMATPEEQKALKDVLSVSFRERGFHAKQTRQ